MSQYATQPVELLREDTVVTDAGSVTIRLTCTHMGKYRITIDGDLLAEAPNQICGFVLFDMVRDHLPEYWS